MRVLIILSIVLASVATAHADELDIAYQKEYAYLVAEKKALQQRLSTLKTSNEQGLNKARREIDVLQKQYLNRKNQVDRLNQEIVDASRNADFAENDNLLLETTLMQAKESLKKLNLQLNEEKSKDQQLLNAFTQANKTIANDGALQKTELKYFNEAGQEITGEVLNVGRIAKFGLAENAMGALAPSGNGLFKVWDQSTQPSVQSIKDQANPTSVDVFLFDNADKAIEKQDDRGLSEDVKAGGLIGKVILVIGAIGAVLVAIRIVLLVLFSSDIHKRTKFVNEEIKKSGIDTAIELCKKNISSASRVIAATLRNIEKERDHIEDIISESILFESSRIDRFGSAILVIAAVAPLLGLLGTVTGMISTFDIITEFGTGDPKLLSTGISEALVTTKFGLVVAIPLLLLGNVLSSWATRTKADLERAALSMINTHKTA